ncbi:MAG: hypothetical protein E4G91_09330 [Candidatus Zixiibacteriota bacterium]|nr:MAG: hypothetical protein E4G91_09330 [candidate division Zixibacteria bacterium]
MTSESGQIDIASFLERNLSRQITWISVADSKISFVFAVNTAMLGVLAAVSPKVAIGWDVAPAIFAAFAAAFGLASLLFLSFASFPRTKGPKNSLIYFGGIAQRDVNQFKQATCEMTLDSYIEDLSAQCHRNAEIAERKFIWVQRALIALYLSVPPWCVAVYLLYNAQG